jgi:glycosyltransferase involved in cell wall biosynthesis
VNKAFSLISVVIPTYNRSSLIGKSIESVFSQDYPNLEVIVVDDGSTDDTQQVIEVLKNPKLRYFRHEQNRGAPAARNTGLHQARGEYIAFLDSDDAWIPGKLSKQMEVMLRSDGDVALVYGGMRKIDDEGNTTGYKKPRKRGNIYQSLLKDNIIGSTSIPLLKTKVVKETGGFDEELRSRQDYDLWLRIAKLYKVDFVPEPLVLYRVHRNRISGNVDAQLQGTHRVLEKYFEDIQRNPAALAHHYYLLGWLYNKKGDKREAHEYFKKSLKSFFRIKTLYRYYQTFF